MILIKYTTFGIINNKNKSCSPHLVKLRLFYILIIFQLILFFILIISRLNSKTCRYIALYFFHINLKKRDGSLYNLQKHPPLFIVA